jgi:hypothetical protein
MKNIIVLLALALFVSSIASLYPAMAQDNSLSTPAVIGSPVRSMVELGSVMSNIYDITITVQETVRGAQAMERLKAASPGNPAAPEGLEYVLARIKFELKGRAVSDRLSFDFGDAPMQWMALSSDLTEYPRVSVTLPKPALAGKIQSGQSTEGWVAFVADQKEAMPIMVFDPDTGGATGRGRTLFFKLH